MNNRKKQLSAFLSVGALWLAAPAAASAGRDLLSYGGTECHEAVALFDVDADRVRPYVPSDYALGTFGVGEPKVAASVAGLACEKFEVDGQPSAPWKMAWLSVQVRPPDRSYFNNYLIWGPTQNAGLHSRLAGLGLGERGYLGRLSIDSEIGELQSSSVMTVPWSYSPHTLRVETAGPFSAPLARGFTIWRSGSHGNVVINGQIANERLQAGTATVTAAPGSPLARIIGSERVTGAALISTFEFTATVGPA